MKIFVEDYCDFINYILKTSFVSTALQISFSRECLENYYN